MFNFSASEELPILEKFLKFEAVNKFLDLSYVDCTFKINRTCLGVERCSDVHTHDLSSHARF